MSTDTAFALGTLALVGPRFPDRLRAFMLTLVVVDDLARPSRHRDGVHGRPGRSGARGRIRTLRARARRPGARRPQGDRLRSARSLGLGGAARVGSRAGRRRPGHGAPHVRVPRRAVRPGAGDGALPAVPRAADPRAGAGRPGGSAFDDLAERAAAAALPPLDELRDRAALRARERRRGGRSRRPPERVHVARSPSGSCSATSSASPSASSAPPGSRVDSPADA